MGKPMRYVLSGGDADRDIRVITYGKCLKSPYAENQLWFVHVPKMTEISTTFLVNEQFARPNAMDEFETDLEKWGQIAHKIIPGGDWNYHEECLWHEMPFHIHRLPNDIPVRYGLSQTQSFDHPERELWYIVIGLGSDIEISLNHEMFIVDKICTETYFLDFVATNVHKWQNICWSHPVTSTPWQSHLDQTPNIDSIRSVAGEAKQASQDHKR